MVLVPIFLVLAGVVVGQGIRHRARLKMPGAQYRARASRAALCGGKDWPNRQGEQPYGPGGDCGCG